MSRVCDICLGPDGEHVSIYDDDGAVGATACPACFDALGGEGCCVCGDTTSGEYHVARDGRGPSGGPLCGTCRRLWLTGATGGLAARILRLGLSRFTEQRDEKTTEYDDRGNPIPDPADTCEVCGRTRAAADEMNIEVLEPYGEVEYLCGACDAAGRGLK